MKKRQSRFDAHSKCRTTVKYSFLVLSEANMEAKPSNLSLTDVFLMVVLGPSYGSFSYSQICFMAGSQTGTFGSSQPFTWIVPGVLMGGEKRKAEKARYHLKASLFNQFNSFFYLKMCLFI